MSGSGRSLGDVSLSHICMYVVFLTGIKHEHSTSETLAIARVSSRNIPRLARSTWRIVMLISCREKTYVQKKLVEVRHDQSVVENWAKRSHAMSGTAESPRYDYRIAAL